MSSSEFESAHRDLALGGFRYFKTAGSTNDIAIEWASMGAPDLSLVVAEEQVSGRGRDGRKWFTHPGAGLAFSLVLRPTPGEREHIARFTGLAALALVHALKKNNLSAQIKWPNDVLIRRKKVAGILIETDWLGDKINSLVLGMGVNVSVGSVPPDEILNYPATCLETELGAALSRFDLLRDLILELINLRKNLGSNKFLDEWQSVLAYRGESVQIWQGGTPPFTAQLLGLNPDGSLQLSMPDGRINSVNFGEVNLRPLRPPSV